LKEGNEDGRGGGEDVVLTKRQEECTNLGGDVESSVRYVEVPDD
jgi:hypothetical protein